MPTVKVLSIIWVAAMIALPGAIYGQDAKLIEGARKEGGKVVVYGSIENDTMDLIAGALKKRPGSKLNSGAPPAPRSWTGCLTRCAPASLCTMWC